MELKARHIVPLITIATLAGCDKPELKTKKMPDTKEVSEDSVQEMRDLCGAVIKTKVLGSGEDGPKSFHESSFGTRVCSNHGYFHTRSLSFKDGEMGFTTGIDGFDGCGVGEGVFVQQGVHDLEGHGNFVACYWDKYYEKDSNFKLKMVQKENKTEVFYDEEGSYCDWEENENKEWCSKRPTVVEKIYNRVTRQVQCHDIAASMAQKCRRHILDTARLNVKKNTARVLNNVRSKSQKIKPYENDVAKKMEQKFRRHIKVKAINK